MKTMKRIGGAVLALGLSLGLLSGCGASAPSVAEATPMAAETAALPVADPTAPTETPVVASPAPVVVEPQPSAVVEPEDPAVVEPEVTPEPEPAETADPAPTDTAAPEPAETAAAKPEDTAAPEPAETAVGKGFTEFDSTLISFLEESGYREESFLVSPLSFRAALALAVSGADGETKEALLHAMGFSDMEEVTAWYAGLLDGVRRFQEELDLEKTLMEQYPDDFFGSGTPDRAYSIANSLWHNSDFPGGFREDYVLHAKEWFDAAAEEVPGAELAGAVNDWANEKTNGMIPSIADDLSDMDAVLVNALYLRTTWLSNFLEYATHPGDFTTFEGETVTKDFMTQQDSFRYYEEGDAQLVVLPMKGNIKAAFVLGEIENLPDKLAGSESNWTEVVVTLPKFELETNLSGGELVEYLRQAGAGVAMSDSADFSAMSDIPWCIGDIIQKSKIKMDEDGIEAAAVTAILMEETSAMVEPPQPKVFTADRPFTFYLYIDRGTPELLFYGQYLG